MSEFEKFVIARWMYGIGRPIMTDAEYAALHRCITSTMPESEYLKRSWSSDPCPVELLKCYGYEDAITHVKLLDRTESIPSVTTWSEIHNIAANFNGAGTLSMKHDGWNVQGNYYNGELIDVHTRGRAAEPRELEQLYTRFPKTIPYKGSVKIVQEATVSKSNFSECVRLWNSANERTAVSSILANPQYTYLLELHAVDLHGVVFNAVDKFRILQEIGFNVPEYQIVHNYDELLTAIQFLSERYHTYNSPTDGVVFDSGNSVHALRVQAWEEPIFYSYVNSYGETHSAYRIVPEVRIQPILREGTMQRVIPITNWQRIIDNDLQIGSPIAFRVASGAIADFDEEATRLAHKEWEGRYDIYRMQVDTEEERKQCLRQFHY